MGGPGASNAPATGWTRSTEESARAVVFGRRHFINRLNGEAGDARALQFGVHIRAGQVFRPRRDAALHGVQIVAPAGDFVVIGVSRPLRVAHRALERRPPVV